jgi:hypothetical protein
VTALSIRFAKAVAKGRTAPAAPATREGLLVTLLRKRATAQCIGATDLEAMLRAQILWSLPTMERALFCEPPKINREGDNASDDISDAFNVAA